MNATTLRQAAYPTTRAIAWAPSAGRRRPAATVGAALRLLDGRPGPVLVLGAAAMAAVLVFSLRDPVAALLAAAAHGPHHSAARCAWRLVGAVALPAVAAGRRGAPGRRARPGAPGLALAATGVAVATWLPVDRDIAVAAAVPLVWASAAQLLGGRRRSRRRRRRVVAHRPVVGRRRGRALLITAREAPVSATLDPRPRARSRPDRPPPAPWSSPSPGPRLAGCSAARCSGSAWR